MAKKLRWLLKFHREFSRDHSRGFIALIAAIALVGTSTIIITNATKKSIAFKTTSESANARRIAQLADENAIEFTRMMFAQGHMEWDTGNTAFEYTPTFGADNNQNWNFTPGDAGVAQLIYYSCDPRAIRETNVAGVYTASPAPVDLPNDSGNGGCTGTNGKLLTTTIDFTARTPGPPETGRLRARTTISQNVKPGAADSLEVDLSAEVRTGTCQDPGGIQTGTPSCGGPFPFFSTTPCAQVNATGPCMANICLRCKACCDANGGTGVCTIDFFSGQLYECGNGTGCVDLAQFTTSCDVAGSGQPCEAACTW